jgi:hypothetical protein
VVASRAGRDDQRDVSAEASDDPVPHGHVGWSRLTRHRVRRRAAPGG